MDDSELMNELLELTLACQMADANSEQRARLERLLADNPQAILWYLRIVDDTLTLLALQFAAKAAGDPEGFVTLFFADGGAIRLHVECIEAELRDLERLSDQPDAAKAKPNAVTESR